LALVITVIALPGVASAHWDVDRGGDVDCLLLRGTTAHGDLINNPWGHANDGLTIAGETTDENGRNGVDPIVRPGDCD
jgi:hypothetical protein